MGHPLSGERAAPAASRVLAVLTLSAALSSTLMLVHAVYGAHRYENPTLYHVIVPALFWFAIAAALAAIYSRHPGRVKRWLLVALVALPYIGIFGLLHGAIAHGLKLIMFAMGTVPEQLAQMFDWADFVVPNDMFFEVTGVGTFLAAIVIGYFLIRFLRQTKHHSAPEASDGPVGAGSVVAGRR